MTTPHRALILGVRELTPAVDSPGGVPPLIVFGALSANSIACEGGVGVPGWLEAIGAIAVWQGGHRGARPPYPMGVEEPDGDPHLGGPPKGALRGGPGGYPPWALWGTPQGGPSRGTPRDPRGTKKCTFRGVFNKSPIRDKHGTQFLDKIGTFWDKHGPPHTGPYGGTPPNPPFWDPPWDPPFRYIF